MKLHKVIILTFIILVCSMSTASAGITDTVAKAFTDGIEGFFILAADTMFSMSFGGYDNSAGNNTIGIIYNIASYTPDPMKSTIVIEFMDYSKSVFKACYPILLLCAMIAVLINHYKIDIAQRFAQATGVNIGSKSNILVKKAIDGLIIAFMMYMFILFVLTVNNLLTKSIMFNMLEVVSPTPDNFILYFFMAIAYLILGFFFSMRILILYLFCGFALIIGLCILIDYTNEAALKLCAYFVQIVFFQFIIVLYFSACILIIKAINTVAGTTEDSTMYTVMILGGVYISIKMMFGTGVIQWAGKSAARLV